MDPGSDSAPSISADGNIVAFLSDGGDAADPGQHRARPAGVRPRHRRSSGRGRSASRWTDRRTMRRPGPVDLRGRDGHRVHVGRLEPRRGRRQQARRRVRAGHARRRSRPWRRSRPTAGPGTGRSEAPSISADGRMVAFQSAALDIVGLGASVATGHLAAVAPRADRGLRARHRGRGDGARVGRPQRPPRRPGERPARGRRQRPLRRVRLAPRAASCPATRLGIADVFLRDMPPVAAPHAVGASTSAPHDVGVAAAPAAAPLGNAGWGPLAVGTAAITGSDRADFDVVADACAGRRAPSNREVHGHA